MQVAVIGPGEASDDERTASRVIGAGLAEAGVVVITGGRGGVMAAATAGARDAGGVTVALLPEDVGEAEVTPTATVPTGLGEARNVLVVRSADAVVAIGGSWGTLSEVALAVRRGTPVVGLRTWRLTEDLAAAGIDDPIVRADTPESALQAVLGIIQRETPA